MADRESRNRLLAERYLPDDLLERFRERAAVYDRENRFFDENFAELREGGYLLTFAPEAYGGAGLSLAEVSRLQQRLASAAPSTALAVNMHLLCLGVVAAMFARGDRSLAHVFEEAAAGEVFAFGISEPGNDWVLQDSKTTAVPASGGGYELTGVKIFTSLSPVWTRLIVHGRDESGPEPLIVFGFLDRATPGITVSDEWDVLGMRATQSRATILTNARLRPERVARTLAPGRTPDLLTFAISANFQLLVASVYAGIARRSLDLATAALHTRRSARYGTTFAQVPESRLRLASAYADYLPVEAQLDAYTRDFDDLVDYGTGWGPRLVNARVNASRAARRVTEAAFLCVSGAGYSNSHELARLLRDATAGLFHPPSEDAALTLYAATLLDD